MHDLAVINDHASSFDRSAGGDGYEAAGEFIRWSARNLRALNGSTEEDFLSVGAYLQNLSSQAAVVAKAADSIVVLITGKGVEKAMERLSEVIHLIDEYLRESQAKFQRDSGSLLSMLNVVETAHRPLSVFKTIVKHLHMLGVSTRIENARLNKDGSFDALAEHVEALSVVIASKSEGILDGVVSLHEAAKQTLSKVLAAKDVTHGRTREILDSLASSLATLFEKRRSSSQTAIRLAKVSGEVSADMSEVISSLQFHDITRQQIEHVTEVFDELAAADLRSADGENDITTVIGEIGCLQIDQLDHARREMLSAVGRLMEGLHGIARRLSGMLKETETLIGVSGKENSSFLSDLNHSVSFVIGSLARNRQTDEELGGAVDYVSGLIQNLSAFVNDIEEIASEIELIAINAQIRAARTAGGGGALGILAEAVRELSDSTRGQTLGLTRTLTHVSDAALELRTVGDDTGRGREVGMITAEMESLLDSLWQSHERLLSFLDELGRKTGELTAGIETVVKGISAHNRTNEVVSGVITGLQQIVARRKMAGGMESGKTADHLSKLTTRYTMHQERSLHQAHVNRIHGSAPIVEEKRFADNVELF